MHSTANPLACSTLTKTLRAVILGLLLLAGGVPASIATIAAAAHTAMPQIAITAPRQQPLYFEPNRGQTDPTVRFLAHGQGYTLFLTDGGAVFRTAAGSGQRSTVVEMALVGARTHAVLVGKGQLAGHVNYLIGHTRHTNIPTYAQVVHKDIYPGIDEVFYSQGGQLEYDFVVHPGANPAAIQLRVTGAAMHLDRGGTLLLRTAAGTLAQQTPTVYQQGVGRKVPVAGRYRLLGQGTVGFTLGSYDRSRTLVIDPLVYSTYLGGSGTDVGTAIAVDGEGNAYATGSTTSTDFPVSAKAKQSRLIGSGTDAFVAKLSPGSGRLLYATYLGGSGSDAGTGIAVDSSGKAYISGNTSSNDFPVTSGAAQTKYGGGGSDAFVAELQPDGSSLVYATYLGGSGNDTSGGIALDSDDAAYVVGTTASADFPVTSGALQTRYQGVGPHAFVAKLHGDGSSLVFGTYLGGSGTEAGNGITVEIGSADLGGAGGPDQIAVTGDTTSHDFPTTTGAAQNAYPGGGSKAFVAALKPTGRSLIYATYLGGNGTEHGRGIAQNGGDQLVVTGSTTSRNFPVTNHTAQRRYTGFGDAFVVGLANSDGSLDYGTYLGGSGSSGAHAIAYDDNSNIYVTGGTDSRDLPTTSGAMQLRYNGRGDAFVAIIRWNSNTFIYNPHASVTYLGGSSADEGNGIAVDSNGHVLVTGDTRSTNFSTTKAVRTSAHSAGATGFVTSLTLP